MSHCEQATTDKCLHTAIVGGTLYFGFYGDDLSGATQMNFDQWYHVAYIYNRSTSKQFVYLNGKQDGSRTSNNPFVGNASRLVIGAVPELMGWTLFRAGYFDQLIFLSRIKTDDELLEEATLVAYYPFDQSYLDSGPNQINNSSGINTTFDSNGHFNQSLVIGSVNSSYFQTTGFYYLCRANYSYSFAMWINPLETIGTILQVKSFLIDMIVHSLIIQVSFPNGWCMPMIGFSNTGLLTIQTLGNNGIYAASMTHTILLSNTWIHLCMTYSTDNGIQLFINGVLATSTKVSTDYLGNNEFCTIVLGTGSQPNICAVNQTAIDLSQFRGRIDELRIYSRELFDKEIYQLAST